MKNKFILPLLFTTVLFVSCTNILEDPIRLVFQIDYPGSWTGVLSEESFYPSDNTIPTTPSETAESQTLSYSGTTEYTRVPDKNLYFISASKQDALTNRIVIRIYKLNLNDSTRTLLIETSTTDGGIAVSTNIYTPNFNL